MFNSAVLISYFLMWYLLILLACLFVISGLDDLFIDVYYWVHYLYRLWRTRHYKPLTYEKLIEKDEQKIAILVPCWQEANVIGVMLKHNYYSIDYKNYVFFIGVYPNDEATIDEIKQVKKELKNIHYVVSPVPGPSNKAANLNSVYTYIKNYEKNLDKPFDIYVFHDSEDLIHPLSFKIYNHLLPRVAMIQIPIFPLEVGYLKFTHWLYADEFSENHTKDIIVRESIGGHVPSAGVGTAFTKATLKALESAESGQPFSTSSITEDYHTSLKIRTYNFKQIFVTQKIKCTRWVSFGIFKKKYKKKVVKEYVATRALFPMSYTKSVRQKSRWIIGIVFQEWKQTKWTKQWQTRYTLFHDRKSSVTHLVNGLGCLVFIYWFFYSWLTYFYPEYPALQEQLNLHPQVGYLMFLVFIIMIERIFQRAIAVKRIYSWLPAILSIPRVFYGNILNMHALIRAYRIYFQTKDKSKNNVKQPKWDKTDHHFPGSHVLTPYHKRLGDLLLERKLLTERQLKQCLIIQKKTGERLGEILISQRLISQPILKSLLAIQYKLELVFSQPTVNSEEKFVDLPKKMVAWLLAKEVSLIDFDKSKNILTLAIPDPTNQLLIKSTMDAVRPYQTKFVLVDEDI